MISDDSFIDYAGEDKSQTEDEIKLFEITVFRDGMARGLMLPTLNLIILTLGTSIWLIMLHSFQTWWAWGEYRTGLRILGSVTFLPWSPKGVTVTVGESEVR